MGLVSSRNVKNIVFKSCNNFLSRFVVHKFENESKEVIGQLEKLTKCLAKILGEMSWHILWDTDGVTHTRRTAWLATPRVTTSSMRPPLQAGRFGALCWWHCISGGGVVAFRGKTSVFYVIELELINWPKHPLFI